MTSLHLETDASLNPTRTRIGDDGAAVTFAGGGIVVRGPDLSVVATYSVGLGYVGGAHEAEFRVLLRGMEIARRKHGATALRVRTDCLPLVRAFHGEIVLRSPVAATLLGRLRAERDRFARFDLRWARSSHSLERADGAPTADALARKAAGLGSR